MQTAVLTVFVLALGSLQTAVPDSTRPALSFADSLHASSPFADVFALVEWMDETRAGQLQFGNQPVTPNRGAPEYLWAVGADTTLWIQSPTGDSFVADTYAIWQIGDKARSRIDFDEAVASGIGYGVEDGRVFLYFAKGAPISVVVLLALAILGVIAWLAVQLRRARQRSRELAESRRRLTDSREAERLRLARELHDGPLQDLQVLHMQMGLASHRQSGEAVQDTAPSVVGIIGELREIAEGLRPPVLGTFGLGAAVRALAERHRATSPDTQIDLDFSDEGDQLPDDVRLALYRIVQEALSNALHHGAPRTVRVHYRPTGSRLHLTIEDDGTGLTVPANLHAFEADGHLGLAGMAERAESIGGKLTLRSEPGATRVSVTAPLAPSPLPA